MRLCSFSIPATVILLSSLSAEGSEHTLQEIRDALTEEYTSLRSFYVKFSFLNEPVAPDKSPGLDWQCECWIDGSKRAAFVSSPPIDVNRSPTWSIQAFDGQWTQIGLLTSLEPRHVQFLQRYRGEHPQELDKPEYLIALGQMFMNEPGNLATVLEGADARLVGEEAVDGHPCVCVESGKSFTRAGGGVLQYTAWLDPAMHWLPRRLVSRFHPESRNYEHMTKNGQKTILRDYRALKFEWFPDPFLGRDRPLPTQLVGVGWTGRYTIDVQDLQVNSPIAAERFVVAPTFGTKVLEGGYRDDPLARRWIHGGLDAEREDRRQKIEIARQLAEQAKEETARILALPDPPVATVDATPRAGFSRLWWAVGGSSCILLGIAVLFSKRH